MRVPRSDPRRCGNDPTVHAATQALRAGSAELLERELQRVLVEGEPEWVKDDRDLLIALAPFHDCARRLGVDVAEMFARVAQSGPTSLAATVRMFGVRQDITPSSFGYRIEETATGPQYRSMLMHADELADLEAWLDEET
jgi:hypothetical protein